MCFIVVQFGDTKLGFLYESSLSLTFSIQHRHCITHAGKGSTDFLFGSLCSITGSCAACRGPSARSCVLLLSSVSCDVLVSSGALRESELGKASRVQMPKSLKVSRKSPEDFLRASRIFERFLRASWGSSQCIFQGMAVWGLALGSSVTFSIV